MSAEFRRKSIDGLAKELKQASEDYSADFNVLTDAMARLIQLIKDKPAVADGAVNNTRSVMVRFKWGLDAFTKSREYIDAVLEMQNNNIKVTHCCNANPSGDVSVIFTKGVGGKQDTLHLADIPLQVHYRNPFD